MFRQNRIAATLCVRSDSAGNARAAKSAYRNGSKSTPFFDEIV